MNQVISQSHLVLLLGLIQVSINHLQDGILGVHLSVMVLLVNLHLLLELLCLRYTHNLSPMSQNLHAVEVCHLLLFIHSILEIVSSQFHLLLLLIQVLDTSVLVPDLDECALLVCC
jgi:hypothetical protein